MPFDSTRARIDGSTRGHIETWLKSLDVPTYRIRSMRIAAEGRIGEVALSLVDVDLGIPEGDGGDPRYLVGEKPDGSLAVFSERGPIFDAFEKLAEVER